MINTTVSLQTKLNKSPYYFAVIHWLDDNGKDKYKWKSTKVKYIDNSQKRLHKQNELEALNKAEELRKSFEDELNAQSLITSDIAEALSSVSSENEIANQSFASYLIDWAISQSGKKEETTSSTYQSNVKSIIAPFFAESNIALKDLKPIHLQRFYDFQYSRILTKGKNKGKPVSKNTVYHYHCAIHKALNDAVKLDLIPNNPDDRTNVARPEDSIVTYYNEKKAMKLLHLVHGHPLEVLINIATCYRSAKVRNTRTQMVSNKL